MKDTELNDEVVGTTGPLVDFFNANLTQEEWNALTIIHNMKNRLNIGVRFDWSRSIDVKSIDDSQIIDESVFISKFKK